MSHKILPARRTIRLCPGGTLWSTLCAATSSRPARPASGRGRGGPCGARRTRRRRRRRRTLHLLSPQCQVSSVKCQVSWSSVGWGGGGPSWRCCIFSLRCFSHRQPLQETARPTGAAAAERGASSPLEWLEGESEPAQKERRGRGRGPRRPYGSGGSTTEPAGDPSRDPAAGGSTTEPAGDPSRDPAAGGSTTAQPTKDASKQASNSSIAASHEWD